MPTSCRAPEVQGLCLPVDQDFQGVAGAGVGFIEVCGCSAGSRAGEPRPHVVGYGARFSSIALRSRWFHHRVDDLREWGANGEEFGR